MPTYRMQAWSLEDLGNPPILAIGESFTVSASAVADIVAVNDGGTDDTPDDFNPVDQDQLVSGTIEDTTYTDHIHEYELAYQVTDGTNTFVMVWVNLGESQQGNNQTITSEGYFVVMEDPSNPGEGGIVPGTTYTIINEDISVNFDNRTSFEADPVYSDFFVCFARGTRIVTDRGETPVECLKNGDLVRTLDHGFQPIRWINHRTVCGLGNLSPIVFDKGALGNTRRLTLSPQHRVLLSDWRAELYFGQSDILIAAKHLVNGESIRQVPCDHVEYWHFMFDQHEVVHSNGALTESYHPGEHSMSELDAAAREEILQIFPELAGSHQAYGPAARMSLSGFEGSLLTRVSA